MTEGKLDSDDIITIIEAVRAYERSLREAEIKGLSIDREIAKEFLDANEDKCLEMIMGAKEMSEFCAPLRVLRKCVWYMKDALQGAFLKENKTPDNKVTIYRYHHDCIDDASWSSFGCDSADVVRRGEEYLLKRIARGYGD